MIAGATYTLPIDIGAALSDVAEVIVTLRSEKTGTKRVKRYPHDYDSYLMDDGRIGLRLSQRDTLMLVGRVIVEAQINLIAGSVAKTITAETVISDTLGTEFVPGAADNGENMLDGVTIEIGEPIIPLAVTATDVNAVHYTPEDKSEEKKKQARKNIGALGEDELGAAVDDALAKAKESGEFDGPMGDDYVLTEGDKTEIAEMAAGKLQPGIAELSEAIEDLKGNSDGAKNVWYGTSDTASATAEKVVTTTTGDFKLEAGNILYVKFTNTVVLSAGYISLNVDGNGAKNCTNSGNSTSSYEWNTKDIIGFVWTGTAFERIDARKATTSYYGVVKLSAATNSTSTATAATSSAVKQAYDLANKASSNASTARSMANSAQGMAGSAKTTADNAQTAAANAQSMAGSAQGMASKLNTESVKHTAQTLTDEQKAQARTNIGALGAEDKTAIAEEAAALIDTALLVAIGSGVIE